MEVKIKNTTFTLNQIQSEDLESLKILIHNTIKNYDQSIFSSDVVDYLIKKNSRDAILEKAENGYTIVVKENKRIIGTGNLTKNEIDAVFVFKESQKSSIAKLITEYLIKMAIELNIDLICLNAFITDKKLFLNLGFEIIERTFKIIGSSKLDYFILQKKL